MCVCVLSLHILPVTLMCPFRSFVWWSRYFLKLMSSSWLELLAQQSFCLQVVLFQCSVRDSVCYSACFTYACSTTCFLHACPLHLSFSVFVNSHTLPPWAACMWFQLKKMTWHYGFHFTWSQYKKPILEQEFVFYSVYIYQD